MANEIVVNKQLALPAPPAFPAVPYGAPPSGSSYGSNSSGSGGRSGRGKGRGKGRNRKRDFSQVQAVPPPPAVITRLFDMHASGIATASETGWDTVGSPFAQVQEIVPPHLAAAISSKCECTPRCAPAYSVTAHGSHH